MKSSNKFLKKYLKKLPLGLIVFLGLLLGTLYLFTNIIHEVFWEEETEMDDYVFSILADMVSPKLTGFMETITHFASATVMQICYAVLVVGFILFKDFKRAIEVGVIGIGGYILNYLMKISFQRTRPESPLIDPLQNFSFPSGHATSAFIFYGLLAYLCWKIKIPKMYRIIAGTLLVFFSLLIGFSRVYLRVHFFSDVLAGFCVGFSWLLIATWLFWRLKERSDKEMQHGRD